MLFRSLRRGMIFADGKPLRQARTDVQVAARYSYLDLDDEDVAGGREDGMTLGLNWHLFSNARVSLNYVWGRVRGQGDVNGAQTRFQVDF